MSSHRIERVRELLKRALGEILRREINMQEAGLITVNDITVTGDLQNATVFVGLVGQPSQQKRAMQILERDRESFLGAARARVRAPRRRGFCVRRTGRRICAAAGGCQRRDRGLRPGGIAAAGRSRGDQRFGAAQRRLDQRRRGP